VDSNRFNRYPFELLSSELRQELAQQLSQKGFINASLSQRACSELQISFQQWMLLLLPIAASYAQAPISNFKVAAIAAGQRGTSHQYAALYFGCNYEFLDLPLNYSLHAEQSALSNAWSQGETKIELMAISAAPCGHCRQFLNEMANGHLLSLIFPDFDQKAFAQQTNGKAFQAHEIRIRQTNLSSLLPDAFGPSDLGNSQSLMRDQVHNPEDSTSLVEASASIQSKLETTKIKVAEAAMRSYAPYSGNLAACGILLKDGQLVIGRYAENAAYNPCLYPLPAALSQLNWQQPAFLDNINAIILVENSSKVSQSCHAQAIIESLGISVALESYQINEFSKLGY